MGIRVTTQYWQITTTDWLQPLFQVMRNEQVYMFKSSLFIGTFLTVNFYHICSIKHRFDEKYSSQNIFDAKSFNQHKKQPLCWIWPPASSVCCEPGGQYKYYHCHLILLYDGLHMVPVFSIGAKAVWLTNEQRTKLFVKNRPRMCYTVKPL